MWSSGKEPATAPAKSLAAHHQQSIHPSSEGINHPPAQIGVTRKFSFAESKRSRKILKNPDSQIQDPSSPFTDAKYRTSGNQSENRKSIEIQNPNGLLNFLDGQDSLDGQDRSRGDVHDISCAKRKKTSQFKLAAFCLRELEDKTAEMRLSLYCSQHRIDSANQNHCRIWVGGFPLPLLLLSQAVFCEQISSGVSKHAVNIPLLWLTCGILRGKHHEKTWQMAAFDVRLLSSTSKFSGSAADRWPICCKPIYSMVLQIDSCWASWYWTFRSSLRTQLGTSLSWSQSGLDLQ